MWHINVLLHLNNSRVLSNWISKNRWPQNFWKPTIIEKSNIFFFRFFHRFSVVVPMNCRNGKSGGKPNLKYKWVTERASYILQLLKENPRWQKDLKLFFINELQIFTNTELEFYTRITSIHLCFIIQLDRQRRFFFIKTCMNLPLKSPVPHIWVRQNFGKIFLYCWLLLTCQIVYR